MKRETGPESVLAFGCGEAGRHSRTETGASGGCSRRGQYPDAAAKAERLCGRGAACGRGMLKRLRPVVTESGCTAGIRRRTVPGSSVRSYFPLRSVSDSEAAESSAPAATTPGQPKCAHAAPERNVPSVPPAK